MNSSQMSSEQRIKGLKSLIDHLAQCCHEKDQLIKELTAQNAASEHQLNNYWAKSVVTKGQLNIFNEQLESKESEVAHFKSLLEKERCVNSDTIRQLTDALEKEKKDKLAALERAQFVQNQVQATLPQIQHMIQSNYQKSSEINDWKHICDQLKMSLNEERSRRESTDKILLAFVCFFIVLIIVVIFKSI